LKGSLPQESSPEAGPGTIATGRRGEEGFGYDPVFVPAGERRTVAELGDAWKATNSHRARAAAALAAALYSLLQDLESAGANT
jgi:XTP/dITP diphosphohydrolase